MLLGKIGGIFEYKIEDKFKNRLRISGNLIFESFAIRKKNYEIHIKINVYHIFLVDKHILK